MLNFVSKESILAEKAVERFNLNSAPQNHMLGNVGFHKGATVTSTTQQISLKHVKGVKMQLWRRFSKRKVCMKFSILYGKMYSDPLTQCIQITYCKINNAVTI